MEPSGRETAAWAAKNAAHANRDHCSPGLRGSVGSTHASPRGLPIGSRSSYEALRFQCQGRVT